MPTAVAKKIGGTLYIWACHEVGVNRFNGSLTADRSACQWVKLQSQGTYFNLVDQGRVYDNATTTPYYYYNPSLAVDDSGNMVMAFAASKSSEYIGAMFVGKLGSGTVTQPTLIQGGAGYYGDSYWGDYTHTTFDGSGSNDLGFWTVQQFALSPQGVFVALWGTTITKIKKY